MKAKTIMIGLVVLCLVAAVVIAIVISTKKQEPATNITSTEEVETSTEADPIDIYPAGNDPRIGPNGIQSHIPDYTPEEIEEMDKRYEEEAAPNIVEMQVGDEAGDGVIVDFDEHHNPIIKPYLDTDFNTIRYLFTDYIHTLDPNCNPEDWTVLSSEVTEKGYNLIVSIQELPQQFKVINEYGDYTFEIVE